MTRRYALRDDQWERIENLLPGRADTVGVTRKTIVCLSKLFFIAIAREYRGAIYRNDLAHGKPFIRGSAGGLKNGVWENLFKRSATDADNEYAMIDSAIVRAHQHSAGAKKRRPRRGHRAQQRRTEHKNPRHDRRSWQPDKLHADAWTGA